MTRVAVLSKIWHAKDPRCSMAMSADHRSKLETILMVTSPYEWKIPGWDVKPQTNKQSHKNIRQQWVLDVNKKYMCQLYIVPGSEFNWVMV